MPVEQRSTSNQFRTAGIALLMVGAGLALVLVLFGQGGSGEPATVSLGTDEFALGPAAERAQVIAKTGPFLLPDVSGRGQDRPAPGERRHHAGVGRQDVRGPVAGP